MRGWIDFREHLSPIQISQRRAAFYRLYQIDPTLEDRLKSGEPLLTILNVICLSIMSSDGLQIALYKSLSLRHQCRIRLMQIDTLLLCGGECFLLALAIVIRGLGSKHRAGPQQRPALLRAQLTPNVGVDISTGDASEDTGRHAHRGVFNCVDEAEID